MEIKINKIYRLAVFFLPFWIFRSWFGFGEISSGDAGFYFLNQIKEIPLPPPLWVSEGLGGTTLALGGFFYLKLASVFFSLFGLPWWLIERLVWYFPFLFLTFFSAFFLLKKLKIEKSFTLLGSLFYLLNSYILMIIGGGQISIALSYALLPLGLLIFIKAVEEMKVKFIVLTGLVFALQLSFEPRGFLFALFICLSYYFFNFKFKFIQLIKSFGLPIVLAGLIHFFWILPLALVRRQPFDSSLIKTDWLSFLSLADFSDSLSLLHPNWPENIFGKTSFFEPLFLIFPLVVFSSLLFINLKKKKKEAKGVLFFVLLGLLGAFLAKGVNPPFGFVYHFLYNNIPFFNTFRDPVKFYFFIALSYAFLIPFSLQKIYFFLNRVSKKMAILFVFGFILTFLISIKPAWTGELRGTFKTREIPSEYLQLKEFLSGQDDFFRTLWLLKRHRFGFYSDNHPAIDSENFFGPNYSLTDIRGSKELIGENWGTECFANDRCYVKELAFLLDSRTEGLLRDLGVKYLIVPSDSEGEIFIAGYKHNPQQRGEVEQFLDQVEWLKKIEVTDQIAVYQVSKIKDHFFVEKKEEILIDWQMVNPTKYKVKINVINGPFRLVFSEKFDPLWQAKIGGQTIDSREYEGILNSFMIEKEGNLNLTIEFAPQKYVYWSGAVSLLTLFASLSFLFYGFFCERKKFPL